MAYDPALSSVVLFGGQSGTGEALGDTWEFAHGAWVPVPSSAPTPSPRWGAAMAFDAATGRIVLFGGENSTSRLGDTWIFNGTAWHPSPTASSPSPRAGAAIAFDPALQGVVLFGGDTSAPLPANDSWLLEGGTWQNLASMVQGSPGPLEGPSMSYLPTSSSVLLEGLPEPSSAGQPAASLWALNGATWNALSPGTGPAPLPRASASLVANPVGGFAVLFGGAGRTPSGGTETLGDTWSYGAGGWQNDSPTLAVEPGPRSGAASTFDPIGGGVLLFGGTDGPTVLGDTWSYGPVPVQLTVTVSPTAGVAPLNVTFEAAVHGGVAPYSAAWLLGDGAASIPSGNGSHVYAGEGTYVAELQVNDSAGATATASVTIHVLTPWEATHQWGELALPASRAPSPRWSAQVTYDPAIGAALLFGGQLPGGGAAGDTWVFANGVWINLTAGLATAPSPRWGGALAYDPGAGDLVLFGGSNGGQSFNDTWTYSPAVGWQETPTDTAPGPRVLASLVDDPGVGGDLLFGGGLRASGGGWSIFNDTWEWKDGVWTNLTAPLIRGPPPTLGATITYDPSTQQILMFGGSALPPGGTPGYLLPGLRALDLRRRPVEPVDGLERPQ